MLIALSIFENGSGSQYDWTRQQNNPFSPLVRTGPISPDLNQITPPPRDGGYPASLPVHSGRLPLGLVTHIGNLLGNLWARWRFSSAPTPTPTSGICNTGRQLRNDTTQAFIHQIYLNSKLFELYTCTNDSVGGNLPLPLHWKRFELKRVLRKFAQCASWKCWGDCDFHSAGRTHGSPLSPGES